MTSSVRLVGVDLSTDLDGANVAAVDLDGEAVSVRTMDSLARDGQFGQEAVASDEALLHLLQPDERRSFVGIAGPQHRGETATHIDLP